MPILHEVKKVSLKCGWERVGEQVKEQALS
jgi:hypothetical protein